MNFQKFFMIIIKMDFNSTKEYDLESNIRSDNDIEKGVF